MTTYNTISYSTNTPVNIFPGFGLMCDNQDIYCDTEEYMCDGSVNVRKVSSGQGLKCNDLVTLCNDKKHDCQGAVIYTKESYS